MKRILVIIRIEVASRLAARPDLQTPGAPPLRRIVIGRVKEDVADVKALRESTLRKKGDVTAAPSAISTAAATVRTLLTDLRRRRARITT